MVSKSFTIKNKMGLHMRPANAFVTRMTEFSSDVSIIYDDKEINGKSIMNLMAAGIRYNSDITVCCSGSDEEVMLSAAAEMIESGFGEE